MPAHQTYLYWTCVARHLPVVSFALAPDRAVCLLHLPHTLQGKLLQLEEALMAESEGGLAADGEASGAFGS